MGKETQDFMQTLKDMKAFLAQKRKITELATSVGVSTKLVHEAFAVKSFNDLTGDKLTVYQKAIELIEKIKSLPEKANEVMNS